MSRSWSCGCARKQQRLVASWSARLFGPRPPSMRVDLLIDHQVLHSFLQRLEARTGGANPSDTRHSREMPRLVSGCSLQPCLLLIQLSDRKALKLSSHSSAPNGLPFGTPSRRARPYWHAPPLRAGNSPVSRYFHSAINSFRAKATMPSLRTRLFPSPNRRSYHLLSSL